MSTEGLKIEEEEVVWVNYDPKEEISNHHQQLSLNA